MQTDPLIDDLRRLTPAAPPPDAALQIAYAAGRQSAASATRWRATSAALLLLLVTSLMWPKTPVGATPASSVAVRSTLPDDTSAAATKAPDRDPPPDDSLIRLTQAIAAHGLDGLPRRPTGGRANPETIYRLGDFR
jgi:hypothetical protein